MAFVCLSQHAVTMQNLCAEFILLLQQRQSHNILIYLSSRIFKQFSHLEQNPGAVSVM